MKKNIAKPIAWSVVGVGILSLVVGTSVDWSHTPLIFASGSSSVQPLIQELSKNFGRADVIANVGGSGMGISEIAQGLKDMGMASKMPSVQRVGVNQTIQTRFNNALASHQITPDQVDPSLYDAKTHSYYLTPNQEFSALWGGTSKPSQTKTITIAWDAIAIVYSRQGLPDGVKLNINNNNIADLYSAFSGYQQFDLIKLINKGNQGKVAPIDGEIPLKPYARSGGANASGTADAFFHDSHLIPNQSDWTDQQKADYTKTVNKSLGQGTYGQYVQTTNESNSQAWNTMLGGDANNRAGKIIYLSSGYVSQNLQEILDSGFDVALYDDFDLIKSPQKGQPYLDANAIVKTYKWYRPFNVMINIPNDGEPKPYLVDFINYLLRESQDGKDTTNQPLFDNDPTADGHNLFEDQGYSPLTKDQIWSMTKLDPKDQNRPDIWNLKSTDSQETIQACFDQFLKEFYISDFHLLDQANMNNDRFQSRIKNGVLYGANPDSIPEESN